MVVQCVRLFMAGRGFCDSLDGESGRTRASKGAVEVSDPHISGKTLLWALPLACGGWWAYFSGATAMANRFLCSYRPMVRNSPKHGLFVLVLVRSAYSKAQTAPAVY